MKMSVSQDTKNSDLRTTALHEYHLDELVRREAPTIPTLLQLLQSYRQAISATRFRSTMLRDYYNIIKLGRTKSQFRCALRFALCSFIIIMMESIVCNPQEYSFMLWFVSVPLIPFAFTMRAYTPNVYKWVSHILYVAHVIAIFWVRVWTNGQDHELHSVGIATIMSLFLLLPISTDLATSITFMYIGTSVSTMVFEANSGIWEKQTANLKEWKDFDVYRRIQYSNKTYTVGTTDYIIVSQALTWIPVFFIAFYLKLWMRIRLRSAFFKLGISVHARHECESALEGQVRWIEAIMPSVIRAEYQRLRLANVDREANMWVFSKNYDHVSILFADIVGFTRMSSNKTAEQVVTMLNDLFNRFDDLCQMTQCEKIATLGDCYYCIAGCPNPRDDHAICCVEMGLGMCRIIKVFNCDFSESVSMRIGVHTGRVNAAIIGSQRYRFDVYSYDVIVASTLESTGRPGRVHVSQDVYDLVKTVYNFAEGEPLEIKKEQIRGIAGMELTTKSIATYFVDPRSSQWRMKHEKFGAAKAILHKSEEADTTNKRRNKQYYFSESDSDDAEENIKKVPSKGENAGESQWDYIRIGAKVDDLLSQISFERDFELIHNLQTDPAKQYTIFEKMPLWPICLTFYDTETEWHYRTHLDDPMKKIYIDSQKLAPLFDALACFALNCSVLVHCALVAHFAGRSSLEYRCVCVVFVCAKMIIICILIYVSTRCEAHLEGKRAKRIYHFFSHPTVREICVSMLTLLPTLLLCTFVRLHGGEAILVGQRMSFSAIVFHCILVHCLPLSSGFKFRLICTVLSSVILLISSKCVYPSDTGDPERLCSTFITYRIGVPYTPFCVIFVAELLLCMTLTLTIANYNEKYGRFCFYVTREAEITADEAKIAADDAADMLDNIIPRYVHQYIQSWGKRGLATSFSYAVSVEHAAVAFATISNFFSKYYREDYKGGENALKLLNGIVCMFDDILKRPDMKDVEKIKTINDCYMVASGLNTKEVAKNASKTDHLVALMNYCHLIIDNLDEFNSMYIIGTDQFEVKVGYNTGPLIAGIIGTTKPMYDIWGNTVNVASRMYSTGLVGKIQVPEDVAIELKDFFSFTYRGEVFVKGKGDMRTYLCQRLNSA
ncbi:unnamed protein product [Calicophoron daubneyi]|uniref:adenylate cyclase n=1 Tax=Calicophoron daubneyi TaxID=300641 RepID=A0AAV2T1L6_CALDB